MTDQALDHPASRQADPVPGSLPAPGNAAAASPERRRTLLGIGCLCLGVLVFSVQDALIKGVSDRYPVTEAMSLRAVVAVPLIMAIIHLQSGLKSIAAPRVGFLVLRALIMFLSYTSYYLAVAGLPLAEAMALFFTAPLFIVVLAVPYLGERVSGRTAAAVLLGLIGVVVMLRPGAGVFDWAALLSLAAAFCYGLAQLMARRGGDEASAAVMSFYQNGIYLVAALLSAGMLAALGIEDSPHKSLDFLVRPWAWPTLGDGMIMLSCGVIATAGTILLTQAYRLAAANTVATFEYTGILWAPLWGLLFFGELPHATTVAGAALIIVAGILALTWTGGRATAQVSPLTTPTKGSSRNA